MYSARNSKIMCLGVFLQLGQYFVHVHPLVVYPYNKGTDTAIAIRY